MLAAGLSGCAVLHTVELGDVDPVEPGAEPIEIMVSETGASIREAIGIARLAAHATAAAAGGGLHGARGISRNLAILDTIAAVSNFGPRTGNPVFDDGYVDEIPNALRQACPTGRLSALKVTRESAKYPVISGEIVRIKGYCLP